MKKTILISVLLVAVSAISYGAYQYFRKPLNIKDSKPDISISPAELGRQLASDTGVMRRFGDSVIVIEGQISSIVREKTTTVILDSKVRCELDENSKVVPNEGTVRIKGILGGYDDLFGEALLIKCQIDEPKETMNNE